MLERFPGQFAVRRLLRIAAWTLIAAGFVAATVPIGARPNTHMPHHLEHVAFFLAVGMSLFGGYPHRPGLVALVVTALPAATQLVQFLAPDRHPRVSDAIAGLIGAWLGIVAMTALERLARPDLAIHRPPHA